MFLSRKNSQGNIKPSEKRLGNSSPVRYEAGATTQSVNVETPALYVTVKLPSETVRKGRGFTLTAEVRDISDNPVEGATVSSTFDGQEMVLLDSGGGEYQIEINTKEYDEGSYTIEVLAEREGYIDGGAHESVTLEKQAGIPGFPLISVIVGLIIGFSILSTRMKMRA